MATPTYPEYRVADLVEVTPADHDDILGSVSIDDAGHYVVHKCAGNGGRWECYSALSRAERDSLPELAEDILTFAAGRILSEARAAAEEA